MVTENIEVFTQRNPLKYRDSRLRVHKVAGGDKERISPGLLLLATWG